MESDFSNTVIGYPRLRGTVTPSCPLLIGTVGASHDHCSSKRCISQVDASRRLSQIPLHELECKQQGPFGETEFLMACQAMPKQEYYDHHDQSPREGLPRSLQLEHVSSERIETSKLGHSSNVASLTNHNVYNALPVRRNDIRAPHSMTDCAAVTTRNIHRPPRRASRIKSASQRMNHIYSERQRRKGMNHLFSELRSLLPTNVTKADRCTTIDEIIAYIKLLKQWLEELRRKRSEIVASLRAKEAEAGSSTSSSKGRSEGADDHWSSECNGSTGSQLALHFVQRDVAMTVCVRSRSKLLSEVLWVIEQQDVQVVNANFCKTDDALFFTIQAKAMDLTDKTKDALRCALETFINANRDKPSTYDP